MNIKIEQFIVGGNLSAAIVILQNAGVLNEKIGENILRCDGTRYKPVSRAVAAANGIHCTAEYKTCRYGTIVIEHPTNNDLVLTKIGK